MAITVSNTGYIKRTAISDLPQPAPGRQGSPGDADARRGFRQSPLHRLHPRLHHDLLRSRPRVLAEGSRDSRRRAGGKGKAIANLVSMEPGERIAALLAVREWPGAENVNFIMMGTQKRGHQEDGPARVQQSACGRHHRDGCGRGGLGDRRRDHRRGERDFHRHESGHGDPLFGGGRPADGPHGVWRSRDQTADRRRSRGDGGSASRGHPAHRHRERAMASGPVSTNTA